jgi:hypothetical protein
MCHHAWLLMLFFVHPLLSLSLSFMVLILLKNTSLFFVLFFGRIGFELSFVLAKQTLYCLNDTSSPFCSGYFGDWVS